jgi:hypothetical protein
MARLIISAIAVSETTLSPESAYINMCVSNAETGESILDIPANFVEIWDAAEKAQIRHFHSAKSGLYTLYADWPERAVVGKVKVYGLLVKVRRSRQDVLWDYGQVIAPLTIGV